MYPRPYCIFNDTQESRIHLTLSLPPPFLRLPLQIKIRKLSSDSTRRNPNDSEEWNQMRQESGKNHVAVGRCGAGKHSSARVWISLYCVVQKESMRESLSETPGNPRRITPPPSRIDGNVKAYQRNRWTDIQYSKFRITSIKAGGICSVSSGYGNGVKEPPNGSWNTPQDSKNPKVSVKNRLWR